MLTIENIIVINAFHEIKHEFYMETKKYFIESFKIVFINFDANN